MTGARYGGAGAAALPPFGAGGLNGGVAPPSSVAGTGLPSGWWKRQEKVTVRFAGQQGFVLNRYMVYGISTEVRRRRPIALLLIMPDLAFSFFLCVCGHQRGSTVQRRYSEFAFLWDCLVRRYPFRLLPQLPPKRIGRT
jgi:sorting nexin-8